MLVVAAGSLFALGTTYAQVSGRFVLVGAGLFVLLALVAEVGHRLAERASPDE